MTHEDCMREAVREAEMSVAEGGLPFAVVVVDESRKIIWRDHDRVQERMDPTAHGEVNAIRHLCQRLGALSLEKYVFYTTSEPCPTCLSAMIKAHVSRCYFGAKIEKDASLPIFCRISCGIFEKISHFRYWWHFGSGVFKTESGIFCNALMRDQLWGGHFFKNRCLTLSNGKCIISVL